MADRAVQDAAGLGPLPLQEAMDLGGLYGLRAGEAVVDRDAFPQTWALAQYMARSDQWDGFGQPDWPGVHVEPRVPSEVLSDPVFAIEPSRLHLADEIRTAAQDERFAYATSLLSTHADLVRFESSLNKDIAGRYPGGIQGFRDALHAQAVNSALPTGAASQLDALVGRAGGSTEALVSDWLQFHDALAGFVPAPVAGSVMGMGSTDALLDMRLQQATALADGIGAIGTTLLGQSTLVVPTLTVAPTLPEAVQAYATVLLRPLTPAEKADVQAFSDALDPLTATALARYIMTIASIEAQTQMALSDVDMETLALQSMLSSITPPTAQGSTPLDAFNCDALPCDAILGLFSVEMAAVAPPTCQTIDTFIAQSLTLDNPPKVCDLSAQLIPSTDLDAEVVQEATAAALAAATQATDMLVGALGGQRSSSEDCSMVISGLISLGCTGDTYHDIWAPLVIDLGGDDTYTINVAGSTSTGIGANAVLVGIDLAGHDTYTPVNGYGYRSLAGAYASAALFFDQNGDDTYHVKSHGRTLGASYTGGSALFVDGAGDDTYEWDQGRTGSYTDGAMGVGVAGFGAFVDGGGNDVYTVDANYGQHSFGGSYQGQGNFYDLAGDDVYSFNAASISSYYYAGAFGAATYYYQYPGSISTSVGGQAVFFEGGGDDTYTMTGGAQGFAFGTLAGQAEFIDASGNDEYAYIGHALVSGSIENNSTWIHAFKTNTVSSLTGAPDPFQSVSVGVDRDVPILSSVLGEDIAVSIVEPREVAWAARDSVITFEVEVANRGDAAASDVQALFSIRRSENDPGADETPYTEILSFGDVPAGGRVTLPVDWTTMDADRDLVASIEMLTVDAVPSNDRDSQAFKVRNIEGVGVTDLQLTQSGRLRPGADYALTGTLQNIGNVAHVADPVEIDVTFTNIETSQTQTFSAALELPIDRISAFYDPGSKPLEVPFSLTGDDLAPFNIEGLYDITVSVDPALNVVCEKTGVCAAQTIPLEVVTLVDVNIVSVGRDGYADALEMGPLRFIVQNIGTVPATVDVDYTIESPYGSTSSSATGISLEPDASTAVFAPISAGRPANGETWHFSALARVVGAADERPDDNWFSRDVRFIERIVSLEDFEVPGAANMERVSTMWERGIPDGYRGVQPLRADSPNAWVTDLNAGSLGYSTNYDLILKGVGLGTLLDPQLVFMHNIDSYASGAYAYNTAKVYVAHAGETFEYVEPVGGYPCNGYIYSQDPAPGFCGQAQGWKEATFDLSDFTGSTVDIMFRYSSGSYQYSGYNGWAIDDVQLRGLERRDGDIEVLGVSTTGPIFANQLATSTIAVRNNGHHAVDVPVTLKVTAGTTSSVMVHKTQQVDALGPGETAEVAVSWTPTSAKRFLAAVTLPTSVVLDGNVVQDPRPWNNEEFENVDVLASLGGSDLEASVAGWTHSTSPSNWADEWEWAEPDYFPKAAYSGSKTWTTDADGPFDADSSTKSLILQSPEFSVSGHTPGDKYALVFAHQLQNYNYGSLYYNDLAYVRMGVNGQTATLLEPAGGYNGQSYTYYGTPPGNGGAVGWSGTITPYTLEVMPVDQPLIDGDKVSFMFTLWTPRYSQHSSESGWTIDDVHLVRLPRFDRDLTVVAVGPQAFDMDDPAPVQVVVKNEGKLTAVGATVSATLKAGGRTFDVQAPVPAIAPGAAQVVTLPLEFNQPFVGGGTISAKVDWPSDEWNRNDAREDTARVGRVFYAADFEASDGGFSNTARAPGFDWGVPAKRAAPGGLQSWNSPPALGASKGGTLTGPIMELVGDDGVNMRRLTFTGDFQWGLDCGYSNMNGYNFIDKLTGEIIALSPAPLVQLGTYSYYAGLTELGHCGPRVGPAQGFTVDLTARQVPGAKFQPEFDFMTGTYAYYVTPQPNEGAQVDNLVLFGEPYRSNLGITTFTSPAQPLLGPGEDATISVNVVNSGLEWPSAPVIVHITSTDTLGPGGAPTLDARLPLSILAFGESTSVGTAWTPPAGLDGQAVGLMARLEVLQAGVFVPLADEASSDNTLTLPVSVLSMHDMRVETTGAPNLIAPGEPLRPISIGVTVSNSGTVTESGVFAQTQILDEAGDVLATFDTPVFQQSPNFAAPARTFQDSWKPSVPGHYEVRSALFYDAQAADLSPRDNTAISQIHAGVLPYRNGNDFDGVVEGVPDAAGWTASGGQLASQGFKVRVVPDPVEGTSVLATNGGSKYEPLAQYRLEMPIDLTQSGPTATLTFAHKYGIASGDRGRVLASDDGVTWDTLTPEGGYPVAADGFTGLQSSWTDVSFDLSRFAGDFVFVAIEMISDASIEAAGWQIDDLRVTSGLKVLHQDGFESPFGSTIAYWDFESGSQGWAATSTGGAPIDWEVGQATKPSDVKAPSGTNVWATNLDGAYYTPPNGQNVGHQLLTSPVIDVPANAEKTTLSYWVNYGFLQALYTYQTWDDGMVVRVAREGQTPLKGQVVVPETGYPNADYPNPGFESRAIYAGQSGGWMFQTIDLSEFAGESIRIVFDQGALNTYAYSYVYYMSGATAGALIDDVALHVSGGSDNDASSAITGVRMGPAIVGKTDAVNVDIVSSGAERSATLAWKWVGPAGRNLGQGNLQVVLVEGAQVIKMTLPQTGTAQHGVLLFELKDAADPAKLDNVFRIAADAHAALVDAAGFDDVGQPCGADACLEGWKHSGTGDEWHHGALPSSKAFPETEHSAPYVYSTDLLNNQQYDNSACCSGNIYTLETPQFTVPADGAILDFWHALDVGDGYYGDGIRVLLGSKYLPLHQPYNTNPCQYYNLPACLSADFDWTHETIDLSPYAGATNAIKFQWVNDYAGLTAPGWTIDDVAVLARPSLTGWDVGVSAAEIQYIDARTGGVVKASLVNPGESTSDPVTVVPSLYLDGVFLRDLPGIAIGPLPPGDSYPIEVPVTGAIEGSAYTFRVVTADVPDADPANDVVTTRLQRVVAQFSEPFEQGSRGGTGFTVTQAPVAPGLTSRNALVAGLGKAPLAEEGTFVLPPTLFSAGDQLTFQHHHSFPSGSGGIVEYSTDLGTTWAPLFPLGGYPVASNGGCPGFGFASQISNPCFSGETAGYGTAIFPLDSLQGKPAMIRFHYETAMKAGRGWAIDNLRILGDYQVENTAGGAQFQLGRITNPDLSIIEASEPHSWGTGLAVSAPRASAWDILQSPVINVAQMLHAQVSFDMYADAPAGGLVVVESRDRQGTWAEVGRIAGKTAGWERHEFLLPPGPEAGQVRFLYLTPDGAKATGTGVFIDNVLVGSLGGRIELVGPKDLTVQDGSSIDLTFRVTNTGAFTNTYTLDVRGPSAFWSAVPSEPSFSLQPGESTVTSATIYVPFLPTAGTYEIQVLAKGLLDPLQASALSIELPVIAKPKPDFEVKYFDIKPSFRNEAGVTVLEDAEQTALGVWLENRGQVTPLEPVSVKFYEYLVSGERRAIDTLTIPPSFLTHLGHPFHAEYNAFIEWYPRRNVIAVEAVVNGEAIGNPLPVIAEGTVDNNALIQAVVVEPQRLPELELAKPPQFATLPLLDSETRIGMDIKNTGSRATNQQVQVAVVAGYEHAYLTSPVIEDLPKNTLLTLDYESDLEHVSVATADGFRLEARPAGGTWETIEPFGGYSHGCVIAFECTPGVSGNSGGTKRLTFDMGEFYGPTEIRVVFGMDSHNGGSFDGLHIQEIALHQGAKKAAVFDFTNTASGWAPGHTWEFRPREGPIPGGWRIPPGYENPFLAGLTNQGPLGPGQLGHVSVSWTPTIGGMNDLIVYIDSKNLELEYVDDLNIFKHTQKVMVSGFDVDVAPTGSCPRAQVCMPGSDTEIQVPITLTNTGNSRSLFDLSARATPQFDLGLTHNGKALKAVELDAGDTLEATLTIRGKDAPALVHEVFVDVRDTLARKDFAFRVPVEVLPETITPGLVGATDFTMAHKVERQFLLENPGNGMLPVLLRVEGKPSGLAVRIQPGEFTLAPFESRAVNLELMNLGVASGQYTLKLVNSRLVCDEPDCDVIKSLTVEVLAYSPPTAKILLDNIAAVPGVPVALRDGSTSPGSSIVAWSWDFGDGQTATTANPSHAYDAPGTYTVRLKVTDAEGQSNTSPGITVVVSNTAPVAVVDHYAADGQALTAGATVNFTAYGSHDAESAIGKVTWSFGDGALASGVNVTHAYAVPGTYRVTVAIEDIHGAVKTETFEVEVAKTDGQAGDPTQSLEEPKQVPGFQVAFVGLIVVAATALRRRK